MYAVGMRGSLTTLVEIWRLIEIPNKSRVRDSRDSGRADSRPEGLAVRKAVVKPMLHTENRYSSNIDHI